MIGVATPLVMPPPVVPKPPVDEVLPEVLVMLEPDRLVLPPPLRMPPLSVVPPLLPPPLRMPPARLVLPVMPVPVRPLLTTVKVGPPELAGPWPLASEQRATTVKTSPLLAEVGMSTEPLKSPALPPLVIPGVATGVVIPGPMTNNSTTVAGVVVVPQPVPVTLTVIPAEPLEGDNVLTVGVPGTASAELMSAIGAAAIATPATAARIFQDFSIRVSYFVGPSSMSGRLQFAAEATIGSNLMQHLPWYKPSRNIDPARRGA